MILLPVNSSKPVAALVAMSPFDTEPLLLPLNAKAQEAFNKRALPNRRATQHDARLN
jgi:hypothetical protein